jgi:hypothetical protein
MSAAAGTSDLESGSLAALPGQIDMTCRDAGWPHGSESANPTAVPA